MPSNIDLKEIGGLTNIARKLLYPTPYKKHNASNILYTTARTHWLSIAVYLAPLPGPYRRRLWRSLLIIT